MGDRVVRVRLLAQVSEYEAGMLKAAQATRRVGSEAEKLEQKRQAFDTFGRSLMLTGAALAGVTALSVKAAIGWESAWAGVTKTVEGTPEQLAKVEEGLRGLTAVLPASHDEIAAVAEAAGQLGIQTGNVVAFTKTMIDLGETTNLSANEAATSLARFVNIMGTSQSKVSNLGSAIVGLGNNYATTEREIMEMAMRLAGAGKQIGLSEGQTLGLATALSSVGIEAEAGGSAMSKVMIDIAASVEDGGAKLDQFAAAAGVSAQDFAKQWKTDPAAALALFVKGLSNAESQGKSTLGILADLGITEVRMRDALLRSSAAADQFAGAMAMGNAEFEKNTALVDEATKRYETVESKLKIAGNAVRDAAIDFGQVFLPAVANTAEAVGDLAEFLGGLPDPVKGIIGVMTGVTGAVALAGGAALLAVPKFAEFKVALDTLGLSGTKASGRIATVGKVAAGAVAGIALAAAGADVLSKAFDNMGDSAEKTKNALATAKSGVDVFIASTGRGFGTQLSAEKATVAVENLGAALDRIKNGASGGASQGEVFAVSSLGRMQKHIEALADVDLSAAQNAFRLVAEDANLTDSQILTLVNQFDGYKNKLTEVATGNGDAADSQTLVNLALGDAAAATEVAADGLSDVEREATEAAQALDGTAQALDDVAGSSLSMGDAKDRALSSLNALTEAAKAEGVSLGGANDASIRLRDSIRDVEQAHRDSAEAIINNGGTLKDATAAWEAGRQKVIDMRVAKGEDIATATAWADKNLGSASEVTAALGDVYQAWLDLPENRETKYKIESAEAERRLAALKKSIEGLPQYKSITLETITLSNNRTLSAPGQATGGPVYGPGPKGVDSELRMLAPGEHVLTAGDVDAMGGHAGVMAMRSGLHSGRPAATLVPARSSGGGGGSGGTQTVGMPPVYVQNPFTGGYLLAQIATVADGRIEGASASRRVSLENGSRG